MRARGGLTLRWRLLIAGRTVSCLSSVLLIARGVAPAFLVPLAVGVVVPLTGLLLVLRRRR